jgi:transcriptional regulator with XRE-family HTH domain
MLVSLADVVRPEPTIDAHNVRRAAFAERLRAAMARKGWGLSETARQASQLLGPDAKFGRAHVWHYIRGRAVPRARQLDALSRALEVEAHDLLSAEPPRNAGAIPAAAPSIVRAQDEGDGTVFLEVCQRVPWSTALEILRVLPSSSANHGSSSSR